MANTKTETTKTTTKTSAKASVKVSPKAAKNTPVKTSPKASAKATQKTETKKAHVFALVAGLAVKIEHKALKQAVAYHVGRGSLKRTEEGIALTAQGKALWEVERVAKDPAKFQEMAAFVRGGECPKEFKGQPITHAADGVQFPNMLYWGSFATLNMRQVFAALWAK